jgi:hypothetical protein
MALATGVEGTNVTPVGPAASAVGSHNPFSVFFPVLSRSERRPLLNQQAVTAHGSQLRVVPIAPSTFGFGVRAVAEVAKTFDDSSGKHETLGEFRYPKIKSRRSTSIDPRKVLPVGRHPSAREPRRVSGLLIWSKPRKYCRLSLRESVLGERSFAERL